MKPRINLYRTIILSIVLLFGLKLQAQQNAEKICINWQTQVGELKKAHWAINDYETITPSLISDAGLCKYSQSLKPELVRIHQALIADSLINPTTKTWDKVRIKKCFDLAQKAFPEAKFLINPICEWPKWMGVEGSILNPDQEKVIIRLYSEFAVVVKELNIPVLAIEIFNEREMGYDEKGKLTLLWNLYNRISKAIQAIDSNQQIAGPALTWPKKEWIESFLDQCGKNTQIFTWHCYVSGSPGTSNHDIVYKGIEKIDSFAHFTHDEIAKRGLSKLQNYLTEYNIQWVWEPLEIRHGSNVGAVFQALAVTKAALQNMDGVMVWHLKGLSYGLINGQDEIRSTGQLYLWGNKYLVGKMVETMSPDPRIEIVAVTRPDGKKSILLINKSDEQLKIDVSPSRIGFKVNYGAQLTSEEFLPQKIAWEEPELKLLACSVTLLSSSKQ